MPPTTGVKIDLGGKQKTLRFTGPSLERLQDERGGETLLETLTKAGQLDMKAVSALVWAGLLHADDSLTRGAVVAELEPPLLPLVNAVVEALKPWMEQPFAGKVLAAS